MSREKNVLVTGCAGFIGFHTAKRLLQDGYCVIGLDNLNDYYDVSLKEARLSMLQPDSAFTFVQAALEDREVMPELFQAHEMDTVIHLAAQAGVRYSLQNPHAYIDSNITGFMNVLEGCRHHGVKHLLYASSSSVYGANTVVPFSVQHNVDHPISLYAATKKANELMAHTYSHLYNLPTTGMRFFTVYGPWGRPDMAPFLFTNAILRGEPIKIFNYGDMKRDFTYVDDIVEAVRHLMERPLHSNRYRIYNVGNSQPVPLLEFVEAIEEAAGKKAVKELLPLQPGDVPVTYADVSELMRETGFRPQTSIQEGVRKFVAWYKDYYGG